jgi:ubiquinone/menaquinone biosynthesis C-methylase UbiE
MQTTKNEQILQEKIQDWFETKLTLSDPWYQMVLKMLKSAVNDFDGKRVIEVGCGIGVFCSHIAQKGGEVVGFDISKSGVQKAKELSRKFGVHDRVEFVICDAKHLPLAGQTQDVVVCSEVLEHIPGHEQAFHEFARVARDTGLICITVPNLLSSLFFEIVFFKVMGQPKYVQRFLSVEKEYIFHYYKVKRLVNAEHLRIVDVRGTDYVHLHPKITKVLRLGGIIPLVSNKLETKKSWSYFGSNIGVIAKKPS